MIVQSLPYSLMCKGLTIASSGKARELSNWVHKVQSFKGDL